MKKCLFAVLLISMAGFFAFSQSRVTLEQAINTSAREISSTLPSGTRIAVLSFAAPSFTMSEHVTEELNDQLVTLGNLTVIGQRNLGLIRHEMDLQLSGSVSDETQQEIGKLLDLEVIVSGVLEREKNNYRCLVQVMDVRTAEIKYSKAYRIRNNHEMNTLMAGGRVVRNFTAGERAGAAALNLVFGLGNMALLDVPNFFPFVCQFYGGLIFATALSGILDDPEAPDENFTKIMMYGGIGFYSFGTLISIIRALTYNKPGAYISQMEIPSWDLALVSDSKGKPATRLSYTMQF